MAAIVLIGLPLAAAAPAPAASKAPAIKKTGKRKPSTGFYAVSFQGQGTYKINYNVSTTVANLTHTESIADGSSFKWDWSQNRNDALNVPYPCKAFGIQQCKGIGEGAQLSKGNQSLAFQYAESRTDTNADPITNTCSGALTLDSAQHPNEIVGTSVSIKATNGYKDLVISVGPPAGPDTPFGISSAPDSTWDSANQSCKSITTDDLFLPVNASGALTSSGIANYFTAKSVPIPIASISSSSGITVGLSGPSAGNGPKPLCGIGPSFSDGVTCTQTGSWSGSITLTRVK